MEGASWQPTTYGNLYEALEKPGTQIRLLKFSSGPQVGILRLDTSVWDVADPPPYVAISYTWGPPKMRLIFINKAAIKVHHNAFYALWQVRQHFSDRYIWIDSISIHQGDTTEKSAQVEMIYQIYRKAWRVAACLGEHTHDGNWLLAMAQSLARLNREVELTRQIASNSEDGTSNQQSPILTYIYDGLGVHEYQRLLTAAKAFADHPYWRRLWIVQEWAASTRGVVVLCGAHRINAFELCLFLLRSHDYWTTLALRGNQHSFDADETSGEVHSGAQAARIMQIDAQERSSLISNVGQWRDMLCADPRDRLYALLGLIDWTKSECEPIVPDYSKSAWDIAVDLAEPLGLIQIQACLRAFQLDSHHVDMLAAVRKQRDLLGQEKAGRAVPSSTQLIKDTALSNFEDFSLVHCARLYLSEDGKLSARVRRSEAYFDVASPKKFLEFARSADERTEVLSQIKDFTLVYARGALAGLLCAGAKSGDILIPIGSTSRCVCLVVRPQTSGEELCDVIGQGFLMNYYCLDPHDNKPGCECYSTLKSNRKIFLANPTIRLTAEEALVLIGQDFEEGTGRTNKYNARARMLRLVTPPVAQPFGVVNLLTRAASWGSDSIDLEELSDNWIDESSSEDTSDHTDQSESDESSDEGHIGD